MAENVKMLERWFKKEKAAYLSDAIEAMSYSHGWDPAITEGLAFVLLIGGIIVDDGDGLLTIAPDTQLTDEDFEIVRGEGYDPHRMEKLAKQHGVSVYEMMEILRPVEKEWGRERVLRIVGKM